VSEKSVTQEVEVFFCRIKHWTTKTCGSVDGYVYSFLN